MKKNKNEWIMKYLLVLMIFSIASVFTACNVVDEVIDVVDETTDIDTDELPIDIDSSIPDRNADIQFYHAWLADCVNDTAFSSKSVAESQLLALANSRIRAAIADPAIINGFGSVQLTERLVWGPVVIVEPTKLDSTMYAASNVMFCLKSVDTRGVAHYSIGISGTNMISTYDWFNEDFNAGANAQHDWPSTGGKISNGAFIGVRLLAQMNSGGKTLIEYLSTDAVKERASIMNVSGHSLGGTLTQVYASSLHDEMMRLRRGIHVSASVYAGPTAGNSEFATGLVNQLYAYQAYNNTLDAIPHAWQASTLEKLCSLYNRKAFCDWTINECPSINGVMKYLQLSSLGGDYTMAGVPEDTTQFTGELLAPGFEDCAGIDLAIKVYYEDMNKSYLMKDLVKVHNLCSPGTTMNETEVYSFFSYLSEMGYQHTTAYFNHFITKTATRRALDIHIPGAKSKLNLSLKGERILDEFLKKIYAELRTNGVTSCGCDN
ncbi:MAG: hypothetical protein ACJASQ_002369 [Crocinitomicaceae bacterium]|jgi:hypothetical protein